MDRPAAILPDLDALDLLGFLLEAGEDRRIFAVADPHGGEPLGFDPAELGHRLAAAEDDLEISYGQIHSSLAQAAKAVEDGVSADDPGLVAQRDRLLAQVARLALAVFGRRAFREDPTSGWTEAEATDRFFAFVRWETELREKARPLALFVSAYGWPRPGGLPYAIYWGLRLNQSRVRSVPAAATYRALLAASPGAGPDLAIADALVDETREMADVEAMMLVRQSDHAMRQRVPG